MIIFCLPSSSSDTTVLINVAMTTPWNMMDQLQNWASLLQDHIDKLRLTAEQVEREFCPPPMVQFREKNILLGERSASSFMATLAALH